MEEDLDKKLKEIRKILDDPFHSSVHRDRYLATLKKRLLQSPPTVDSPHITIFSKDASEEEKIEEDFMIKERDGEIVKGETLFTIEREETASIPEFIEIKPEVSKIESIDKEEEIPEFIEEKKEEKEEIPEFIEVKPEASIKKSIEEEEEIQESVEVKTEEKESELPEWKPAEVFEKKEEEKEEVKKPVEKKKKQKKKQRKHRKGFSIWEPAEEIKVSRKTRKAKDKDLEEKKETNRFEPFLEEEFEEEVEESNLEEKQGEEDVYRYKGYTLYRKEIILNDGSKRVIHFFSREEPDEGEPSPLPDGYEIKMDKKTGIPFIRKKR